MAAKWVVSLPSAAPFAPALLKAMAGLLLPATLRVRAARHRGCREGRRRLCYKQDIDQGRPRKAELGQFSLFSDIGEGAASP